MDDIALSSYINSDFIEDCPIDRKRISYLSTRSEGPSHMSIA